MSKEAKKQAKKQAAEMDMPMIDFFDELLLGKSKKKGGDQDFFF